MENVYLLSILFLSCLLIFIICNCKKQKENMLLLLLILICSKYCIDYFSSEIKYQKLKIQHLISYIFRRTSFSERYHTLKNNNKKELKFIHITKCAGTFIEDTAKESGILFGKFQKEYGHWHELFPNKSNELKMKYDWFIVVRNPYTRILSEYYCQWGGIGNKDIKHSVNQFNQFLINNINNRNVKGYHYTEQFKYIDNTVSIHIIKFENLKEELNNLFNKYNLNINIDSDKRIPKESINKILPFTINDFNNELINLINNVYDKDFKMFNYTKLN